MANYLDVVGLKKIFSLLKTYIDRLVVHTSPDWSDNDVNSKAYVKNRTHYVEIKDSVYDRVSWNNGSITTLRFELGNHTMEDGTEVLKLTPSVKVIDGESTVEKSFQPILFNIPDVNGVSQSITEYPQLRVNKGSLPSNSLYLYKVDTVNQKLYYRIITEENTLDREVDIVNNLVTIYTAPLEGEYNTELEFLEYSQTYHKLDKEYLPNEVIVPEGGNKGDVLTKNSNESGDLKWESPVQFQTFMLLDFNQTVGKNIPPLLSNTPQAENIDVTVPEQYQEEWALASISKYECISNNGEKVLINIGASFSMGGQKTLRLKVLALGNTPAFVQKIQGALMLIKRSSFNH